MKRAYLIILPLLLLLLSGCVKSHCYLCGSPPYEAPCLVDLATGNIGELSVGDNQGARSIQLIGDATVMIDPRIAKAEISDNARAVNEALFCENCLIAISQVQNHGYVIADLSKPASVSLYPAQLPGNYDIRDYFVTVTESDGTFRIAVAKTP